MQNLQPIFSICIPTWNRAEMLHEQLNKFIFQIEKYSLQDYIEIVISNNGSDDHTEEIVQNLKIKNKYIIYSNNHTNKGARFNLLKSLELASGKYLTFLGDDDRYKEDSLFKLVNIIKENTNLSGLFDIKSLESNNINEPSLISLEELLSNYYYLIGNAGLFIIKTEVVQNLIKKFGYEYFSLSWPQTQIIILSLSEQSEGDILIANMSLFSESSHDKVMMYNSYYLLRGLYLDLVDAIEDIRAEIPAECHLAARRYLKNHILQNTFNILQCGVFVDDENQKVKTCEYISSNKAKFTGSEKFYLSLIEATLKLPSVISRSLSNVFIFATRGKKGIEKKNNFVNLELQKIKNKISNNKSVRTFDFNH